MSLADFFSPIDLKKIVPKNGYYTSQLGSKIEHYSVDFPSMEDKVDIAIIGVLDDRNAVNNHGCALAPDYVREKLYQLYEGSYNTKIIDLGNIARGETVVDTYYALKTVVEELMKKDIVPLIIGGGQDLTYAQYLGYEHMEQKVDLLVVDAQFDLEDDSHPETIEATSASYLSKIFLHEPNYLFNYSNMGYQTYFASQDSLRVMEKLYFDVHRLGELTQNIAVSEPIIRNANMLSFDMGAIRSSDAAANANAKPNGFYGEEACQICRYAGFSDKLSSIGFYEFNPAYDTNGQTAMLLSQMIWYFIDGFYNRKKDFPLNPRSQYLIYKTSLKHDDHELVFVKSKKSDRWWMQVPYPTGGSKNERFHLVPCRYEDYRTAVSGEMPDLWWRTYQKLN
ncbi:formimidoylglutamase [Mucilaginibacter sp.]|uniref:formimidoylglutamase n=1 Tax=Mucilaginibacter sp. TaxID=1882438 RepID=UPI000CBEB685|nr:formimidoylglutamase [Mucilaginibacter sp.]PLW89034.1 MAG: arginase [Mucilaginibacter sp.]PMP64449.1 MAG: arginase [Mucilaginibacter sp.]HEK20854.1 arginase [Bacteroidota bacterium]